MKMDIGKFHRGERHLIAYLARYHFERVVVAGLVANILMAVYVSGWNTPEREVANIRQAAIELEQEWGEVAGVVDDQLESEQSSGDSGFGWVKYDERPN